VMEATVTATIDVSAAVVKIGVSGGITVKVEIDLYDPYPETSGGLVRWHLSYDDQCLSCSVFTNTFCYIQVRPFELLALGRSVCISTVTHNDRPF
jgi:hypothetical protein